MSNKKTDKKTAPEVKADQAAQKQIPGGETPGKEELGAKLKTVPAEQPAQPSAAQTDAERIATLAQVVEVPELVVVNDIAELAPTP